MASTTLTTAHTHGHEDFTGARGRQKNAHFLIVYVSRCFFSEHLHGKMRYTHGAMGSQLNIPE
jgi:hypothetical protein